MSARIYAHNQSTLLSSFLLLLSMSVALFSASDEYLQVSKSVDRLIGRFVISSCMHVCLCLSNLTQSRVFLVARWVRRGRVVQRLLDVIE